MDSGDLRQLTEARFIFILGGPGAGKGTQCARLASEFSVVHLSVGELLRGRKASPVLQSQLESTMSGGGLMPCKIVMEVMFDEITRHRRNGQSIFLIDGFPRSMEQYLAFEDMLYSPTAILYFKCSEATMLRRVLNRYKSSGRIDDNEKTFHKRMQGYNDQTVPIIESLSQQGKVIEIDCDGDLDDGYATVRRAFARLISE